MEPFEFVRSPIQTPELALADIRVPPPIMSNQVLDENVIQERIKEGEAYLHRLKERRLSSGRLEDEREAKRYKAEVQTAALVRPLLRVISQANGNEGDGGILPLLHQDIQQLRQATQQQGQAMELINQQLQAMEQQQQAMQQQLQAMQQQLQDMEQRSGQQFDNLQFNMGALAYNSSAMIPQAPIRPLKNNAGNIPRHFPAT